MIVPGASASRMLEPSSAWVTCTTTVPAAPPQWSGLAAD